MNRIILFIVAFGLTVDATFLQKTIQLCVNSNQPNIQSMCLDCDRGRFRETSRRCTGQDLVPQITTQSQAFCLISHCYEQIRNQRGKTVGRKRRDLQVIKDTMITTRMAIIKSNTTHHNTF